MSGESQPLIVNADLFTIAAQGRRVLLVDYLQLSRSRVETAQKFYARIDPAAASRQLESAYLEPPGPARARGRPLFSRPQRVKRQ